MGEEENVKPTIVIGHKNPDTDSICSAICYAQLKEALTGEKYVACRAGRINPETKYVLDTFGVEPPQRMDSLEPTVSDVQYRTVRGIKRTMSLKRAWKYMRDNALPTLAVLDDNNHLEGVLTQGDIARFYIEDLDANALAEAHTR